MKKIRVMCFGDSNTWGAIVPGKYRQYERNENRFTKLLSNKFEILEEGLIGRNAGTDDIRGTKGNRNASVNFAQYIFSHDPLDFVVIMLGTNDLKNFNVDPNLIADIIAQKYVQFTKNKLAPELTKVPKFIIVAPPIIKSSQLMQESKKSLMFNEAYRTMSQKNDCIFLDNTNITLGEDGVHLDTNGHRVLAEKIEKAILSL